MELGTRVISHARKISMFVASISMFGGISSSSIFLSEISWNAYWCLVGNGLEWGMGRLLIVIVDHSRKFLAFSTSKNVYCQCINILNSYEILWNPHWFRETPRPGPPGRRLEQPRADDKRRAEWRGLEKFGAERRGSGRFLARHRHVYPQDWWWFGFHGT